MLTYKEQNEIKDQILAERLDLLKEIMLEEKVECWLHVSREYNEDPMFEALTPSRYKRARRMTIFVFLCIKQEFIPICISMPDASLQKYYHFDFDAKQETQLEALNRILKTYQPKQIAINQSENFAFTDGLSHGLYCMLQKELAPELVSRFVSSDAVGIRLLETRTPLEQAYYPMIMETAKRIIDAAFTTYIQPGKTTCEQVEEYMEEEVHALGLETWFATDVDLQRKEGMFAGDTVIQEGDLVHCDFGIRFLNLCTDTQKLCYIRRKGEETIPDELALAMQRNNRFQDIVIANLLPGRSGNEVFEKSIAQGKEEGLKPMLYTHPLGFHGHGAGPIIGLFTNQNTIPVRGDLLVHSETAWALELCTKEYLEMYGREIYMFTEESILMHDNRVAFLSEGRQKLYCI